MNTVLSIFLIFSVTSSLASADQVLLSMNGTSLALADKSNLASYPNLAEGLALIKESYSEGGAQFNYEIRQSLTAGFPSKTCENIETKRASLWLQKQFDGSLTSDPSEQKLGRRAIVEFENWLGSKITTHCWKRSGSTNTESFQGRDSDFKMIFSYSASKASGSLKY